MKAKCLINKCFNIGNYIATVKEANMNLGVFQCKNYWKWEHILLHTKLKIWEMSSIMDLTRSNTKSIFAWCCKANFKINLPRLKTKQGEPCSYSFKCLNWKGEHQAALTYVSSGSIASIRNGIQRKSLFLFTECSKEQVLYW